MPSRPTPAPPRGEAARWRRRPEERPRQILEAAFKLFGDRGLHQATLDDVAREAGITKGTIYLYFPSKAALFSAMLKSRINDILPPLETAGGKQPAIGPRELTAFGRRLYRFMQSPAYLTMFRTIVGESGRFPELAEEVFRDGILVANRRMGGVLARGMAAGRLRPVDPIVASRAFAGMFLVFAISQRLLGGERVLPIPEATVVKTVTDLFLRGIAAGGGAGSPPRPSPAPARRGPVKPRQRGTRSAPGRSRRQA